MLVKIKKNIGCLIIFLAAFHSPLFASETKDERLQQVSLSDFKRCYIDNYQGYAECASLTVPINWKQPSGDTIDISIAKLPSISLEPSEPLVLLAGGPGQAGTGMGRTIKGIFERTLSQRDIILIDQRGTGQSNPLACELDDTLSIDETAILASVSDCAEKLEVDPNFFDSFSAAHDLDALRYALGFSKLNLWGGSYGTRLAIIYASIYEDNTRALVLDSINPPTQSIYSTTSDSGNRAFERVLLDCAESDNCNRSYPNLASRFDEFLADLSENPMEVTVNHPTSSKKVDILVSRDLLENVIFSALYTPERRKYLPHMLMGAVNGDFSYLLAFAEGLNSGGEIYLGMMLSVMCQEDIPKTVTDNNEERTLSYLTNIDFKLRRKMCTKWPVSQIPEIPNYAPNTVPALLLSGEFDPITPPSLAVEASKILVKSRRVTVPNSGHIVSGIPCVSDMIIEFIKTLDHAALDVSCLETVKPTPFVTKPLGVNVSE